MSENLNDVVEEIVSDAEVMTVPIDDTLSISGEAADAKAVGDALALKADASAVVNIDVNGQGADAQGHILLDGTDIPMSSSDQTTLKAKIEAVDGKTGASIPLTGEVGAPTIATAIEEAGGKSAADIPLAEGSSTSVAAKIAMMDATDTSLNQAVVAAANRTANDIAMSSTDATKVKAAIEGRLKSVNGIPGDAEGDVFLDNVPLADNLRSSMSQHITGTFTARTAGGGTSVKDGDAWLNEIRGNRIHSGYVPYSLTWVVTLVERDPGEDAMDVSGIDRDTFEAYVQASTTLVFSYAGSWSADLTLYGIGLSGTPKNGDVITVTYVKENRGTIIQATPTAFTATGWNLYNNVTGYARVIKYSDTYGYRVQGAYTAVKFSTTIDGAQSTITPADGYFNVPSNGYVWITGGNDTTTEVYATWEDWQDPADHPEYEAYSESEIDLSEVMEDYFPNGLLRVGDIRDRIDMNVGQAISRVQRLEYTEENRAMAEASGRAWECDTNWIYLEREAAVYSEITLSGLFSGRDHGIEFFTGSTVPVYTVILYGNNLKNKLERDVLTISEQSLTEDQQAQVMDNIGVTDAIDSLNSKITTLQNRTNFKHTTVQIAANGWSDQMLTPFTKYALKSAGSGVHIRNISPRLPSQGYIVVCGVNPSDDTKFYALSNGAAAITFDIIYVS